MDSQLSCALDGVREPTTSYYYIGKEIKVAKWGTLKKIPKKAKPLL